MAGLFCGKRRANIIASDLHLKTNELRGDMTTGGATDEVLDERRRFGFAQTTFDKSVERVFIQMCADRWQLRKRRTTAQVLMHDASQAFALFVALRSRHLPLSPSASVDVYLVPRLL